MSRLLIRWSLSGLALLLIAPGVMAAWPQEPPVPQPDEGALQRLLAGEVLVENALLDESGGAARVMAVFRAPAESAWDLLGDCATNYQFVDGLKDCELLTSDETSATTRQTVKKGFFSPRLDYVFETYRQPHSWVVIRLVSGDLEILQGSWRFDQLQSADTFLVTHDIRVKPGFPVPAWMVRRTLKKDIVDMVACLRSITDASGSAEQFSADQKRCPRGQEPPQD